MLFKGGVLTAAQTARIRLPADELRSWAWCTEREAGERLSELLARRTRAALKARPKVQRPSDSQGEFDGADRRCPDRRSVFEVSCHGLSSNVDVDGVISPWRPDPLRGVTVPAGECSPVTAQPSVYSSA
jgi:hypothetical protein